MIIVKAMLANQITSNRKHFTLFLVYVLLSGSLSEDTVAQTVESEYTTLEEALKNPDKVRRLNLQNRPGTTDFKSISKLKNLEYLNLRNTRINAVPVEINTLKNLKVLDLGENSISVLPKNFTDLNNLTELYLDHEKNIELAEDFEVLSKLRNLRILHLEGNNISALPGNFNKLDQIEQLYLNDNQLNSIPFKIKGLKNLKYLDMHNNPIVIPIDLLKRQYGGLKINF